MSQELSRSTEDMHWTEDLSMDCSPDKEVVKPSGFDSLLNEPIIKHKLDENQNQNQTTDGYQTPRYELKRKNPRRCLSEQLINSSFISPERDLSPTFIQSKKMMSIDIWNCSPTLTPIFTKMKTQRLSENSENDSFLANTSITSMTSISPMLSSNETNPMKRPNTPKVLKKSNSMISSATKRNVPFVRSYSANEATIKEAVQLSCADPSLIGDFSKSYALPLIHGKHQDLKSISVDILAQVLDGHYRDLITESTIVDCRYPYEYNGGHIKGARNIYSQEGIIEEFLTDKTTDEPTINQNIEKRKILVFHCEFSSERGPTLSRFLRNNDRTTNKDFYPQLHHPEMYLLEGGYKAFFEKYPNLCEPPEYLPMHSKDYEQELRRFRTLVRSLSTDGKCFGSVYKSVYNNRGFV